MAPYRSLYIPYITLFVAVWWKCSQQLCFIDRIAVSIFVVVLQIWLTLTNTENLRRVGLSGVKIKLLGVDLNWFYLSHTKSANCKHININGNSLFLQFKKFRTQINIIFGGNMSMLDKKYEEEKIGPRVIAPRHNLWYCMGTTCYWYHNTKNTIYNLEIQFAKNLFQNEYILLPQFMVLHGPSLLLIPYN